MTPQQVNDVRRTWAMVAPIADQATILFYDRLFAIDLPTRSLFRRTDMAAQRATLMGTLALVVKGLDELEQGLGDEFTVDVREAWTTAYGNLATVMQEAAARATETVRVGPNAAVAVA